MWYSAPKGLKMFSKTLFIYVKTHGIVTVVSTEQTYFLTLISLRAVRVR
jgi:hypothetical protein